MPTITTGINVPLNNQLQAFLTTDAISTLSTPKEPEKDSAYTLELTAKSRALQREYANKQLELKEQQEAEKQQLEAQHKQEKQQLDQKFKLKEQSVGISIYT